MVFNSGKERLVADFIDEIQTDITDVWWRRLVKMEYFGLRAKSVFLVFLKYIGYTTYCYDMQYT